MIFISLAKKSSNPDYPFCVTIDGGQEHLVKCVREGRIFANGINSGRLHAGLDMLPIEVDQRFSE